MRLRKGATLGVAAIASVVVGAQGGTATRSAAATTTTTSTKFTQGLPLLDTSKGYPGTNTGAAEPSIRVDSVGHVYVTGPTGVPTGGCPLWYIHPDSLNSHGSAYEYRGKFDTVGGGQPVGGGDCDLATGGLPAAHGFDNLAGSSLSLANLTVNRSSDGGATFPPANVVGQQVFGNDRQWNAADTPLRQVYMTVHDLATDNIQVSSSTDGGYTYVSNKPAIETTPGSCGLPSGCFSAATLDNHFGNIVVNPKTHFLYTVYLAPANAMENAAAQQQGANPNEHVVYVAVGNPCATLPCTPGQPIGPISWTDYPVYTAPTGTDLAHVFPSIGIDSAGGAYVTWSDTKQVFLIHSSTPANGTGWTSPVHPTADVSKVHSEMMPWVAGGSKGVADVVWYAAVLTGLTNPACKSGTEPKDDSAGVNNNCQNQWDVDYTQVRYSGTGNTHTFVQSDVKTTAVHNGSLCDQGLNCSIFGGDRTLLDYFELALDPQGGANVSYASDIATPGTAQIMYARQCTGPSATSATPINNSCTNLQPPKPPTTASAVCGTGANSTATVLTDPTGDAVNPTGGPGSTSQVDITKVGFSTDPVAHTLTTTMTIASLTAPPQPVAGTADTYYYVVWSYGGKTYATLASEPQPDSAAYTYGEFNTANNQLATTNPATGSVTAGTPGTISVTVPLSGVGNPAIPVTPANVANAAAQNPYALTISGEGALGTGLVYTHPDDRAPDTGYGAAWSVC